VKVNTSAGVTSYSLKVYRYCTGNDTLPNVGESQNISWKMEDGYNAEDECLEEAVCDPNYEARWYEFLFPYTRVSGF
jgi:hypothetical protein